MAWLALALKSFIKKKAATAFPLTERFLNPQLASLTDEIPTGPNWIFENKFDGYRILAVKDQAGIRLMSRNGKDWTHRFRNVANDLKKIGASSFVLDGEVIAVQKKGTTESTFSALQKRLKDGSADGFTYYIFDVNYLEGIDIRKVDLLNRKKLLKRLIAAPSKTRSSSLHFSEHHVGHGQELFELACENHAEGIIAKDSTSVYEGKRGAAWLKIKCQRQDEFVIGGFTDPGGSREHFGALLVGYFDDKKNFHYAGKVGTGFDQKSLANLHASLKKIEIKKISFHTRLTNLESRDAHYVKPHLVAQLSYTEWTPDGRLRHPVFLGLREDKAAREVMKPVKTNP